MPLDTRIISNAMPAVTPIDPYAMQRGMAWGYKLQDVQREGQLDQLALEDAQRKAQERGTLAQAFKGAVVTDPTTGRSRLDAPAAFSEAYRRSSDPLTVLKAETEYGKSQAESTKSRLEARKTQLEQQLKGLEFGGQIAQGVEARIAAGADPQQAWEWGIGSMRDAGFPIQGITPFYDQSMLAGWKGQAVQLKDRLAAEQKAIEARLREREVAVSEAGVPLTRAKTRREEAEARAAEGVQALEPGATPRTMSEADIADAMRQTGRSRAAVVARAHELGWRTPDRTTAAPAEAPVSAAGPTARVSPPAAAPALPQAPAAASGAPPAEALAPAAAPVSPYGAGPAAAPGAPPAAAPAAAPAPAVLPGAPPAEAPAASPAPVSPRVQEDAQRLSHLVEMRQRQEAHLEKLRPFASSEAGSKRLQQGERELSRLDTQIDRLRERIYEQGPESLARKQQVARAGVDVKLDEPLSTEDAARLGVGLGTTWRDIREGTTSPARGPVPPLKGESAKTYQLGGRMALGHGTVAQLEERGVTGRPFLLALEGAMDKLGSGAVATVLGVATRGAGVGALGSTAGGGALGLGVGNLATGLVNQARTPAERLYVTAQLAFIAGILRKESGAAISAPEYLQYARIYFPQPGDDPDTVAYKRQLRQAEIDALQEDYPNRPFPAAPGLPPAVTRDRPAGVPPGFTRETPELRQLQP